MCVGLHLYSTRLKSIDRIPRLIPNGMDNKNDKIRNLKDTILTYGQTALSHIYLALINVTAFKSLFKFLFFILKFF